jgi:hypothetical protein
MLQSYIWALYLRIVPVAVCAQAAKDYIRRAVAPLRGAVQASFNNLPHLKTNDPDLVWLRDRADFQQLVKEMEAKTKAAPK